MTDAPLILYVDDERANRIVFEQSFGARFKLRTAASGADALAILDAEQVAVILTDQRMPEMSGEELLRIVKDRWPSTVRVVITAHSDVEPILAAINEGLVSRYLIKPWDRAELEQLLRWGLEAWSFGKDSGALQRRLLETERLATLGSIAGAIVHDLNQPLISLLMNSDRLGDLASTIPNLRRALAGERLGEAERVACLDFLDEVPELVADLRLSGSHMRALTTNLGQFLRAAPSATAATTTAPMPVIRHALSVCHDIAVRARGTLAYDGPAELPSIQIGATELTQILINVVGNGAHALVSAARPGGRVQVLARVTDAALVLEIKDDGVGMTPEVLAKVGTPFFTTRREGTGMGLAQVHRLVGKAAGSVKLESREGAGTTVTITLPRA